MSDYDVSLSDVNGRSLIELEDSIRIHLQDKNYKDARTILRSYLWTQTETDGSGSIVDAIEQLAQSRRQFPNVAAVLLRCLAVDQLLPVGGPTARLDRDLVTVAEDGLPRLCDFLGIKPKSQTFEKVPKLRDTHRRICELLSPLRSDFRTLDGVLLSRQPILTALNHSLVRAYGEPFRLGAIRGIIDGVLHEVQEVTHAQATLLLDVERCSQAIQDGLDSAGENGSFIFLDFLVPFLREVDQALHNFIESTRGRFSARITSPLRDGEPIPKRYPLHEVGREIQIRVPLRNAGPGLATDVRAELTVSSDHVVLQTPIISIGSVSPGDFSLGFDTMIIEPTSSFTVHVGISWGEVGSSTQQDELFEFTVDSQSADVDWVSIEYWHPYSTDAAEGERFIGRSEIVKDLAGRLLREPMEPFYITGQKRVGKTSLAKAVAASAKELARHKEIEVTYILWGRIAHADPSASLAELGRAIERQIVAALPSGTDYPECLFDGSLAPVMRLAELAEIKAPEKRFVVIIDEFDEIHQELYLHGNLAETFFANLRAIATTRNICLVLVGGENMPFIMERQGEKLNKFTRTNLNYFSRATEWDDFQQLVKRPSQDVVQWHDVAVSTIFNETNGNPYFTNLLCSRVLRAVLRLRDTDVTAEEIAIALEVEISSLDANSFAHLWHDGVFKPLAEREPDILRRRRVLVALARCARKGLPLTTRNLADNKGFSDLGDGEIGPTLNEFRRRGVLSEDDGVFAFNLPIFERWLSQDGISVVQPDPVSEELASVVQAEEDAAFVRSEEVVTLARKWPTYQGRHVGTDDIRAWYQQVEGFRDQRLLFKLLQGVRFVSEVELREKARQIYLHIRRDLSEFVMKSLSDRRTDILVTYLDGHGKSGELISSVFCEENKIAVANICSNEEVSSRLDKSLKDGKPISTVIVVDDIAATGRTLSDSVVKFANSTGEALRRSGTKLLICPFFATRAAAETILKQLKSLDLDQADFRAGETLGPTSSAFSDKGSIWSNPEERERAKALAVDLGARIYRSNPLGYGGLGLLVVFPTTVPNNSLPILHSPAKGSSKRWIPLFARPTN